MKSPTTPLISILVAARNEARHIRDCLEALAQLESQKQTFEVLIGDDASEDATGEIIEAFIQGKPQFRSFRIPKTELPHMRAKTRVLHFLSQQARGKYILITDADAQVPPNWLDLVGYFDQQRNLGIIGGMTRVKPSGGLSEVQNLEWQQAFALISIASHFQIPITLMGNNLALKKEFLDTIGGFEAFPDSLTEDFDLLHHFYRSGYSFRIILDQKYQVLAEACPDFKSLWAQRKRWMSAALRLPWYIRFCLYAMAWALPILLVLWFLNTNLFLGSILIKFFVDVGLFLYIYRKAGRVDSGKYYLIYYVYSWLWPFLNLIKYYVSRDIHWKGRAYS